MFHDAPLDRLVARAIDANLDLRIAEARVRESRAWRGIARSALWPTVDGGAAYSRTRQSENGPLGGAVRRGLVPLTMAAKRFYGTLFGGTLSPSGSSTTFTHSGARWRWIYRNCTTGSQIRVELNCGKGQASEDDPCIHKMGRSGRWVKEAMSAEGLHK